VKHIKVGAHPEFPESRCFHVVRTDDTTADFSYRKVPSSSSFPSIATFYFSSSRPRKLTSSRRVVCRVVSPVRGDAVWR
jgi:hypothetical protein